MFGFDWLFGDDRIAVAVFVLLFLWRCWRAKPPSVSEEELQRRVCKDAEVLAGAGEVRRSYSLSKKGFLATELCERLPAAYEDWESLARRLPELNRSGGLRAAVDNLAELPVQELLGAGDHALRRAHLLLGMLAHSYVHGPSVPWHKLGAGAEESSPDKDAKVRPPLPPQVARPWFAVCCVMRLPPVITAAPVDLWNWRLKDEEKPFRPENLEQRLSMTGTDTERNFHMVPCAMQAAAGTVLPKLFLADLLVRGNRYVELAALLRELTDVFKDFKEIFGLVAAGVDRETFYDVYRPPLDGFHPEGIVLQGSEEVTAKVAAPFLDVAGAAGGGVCVRAKGPSAGQSTMLLLFDEFLGVDHGGIGGGFQEEMLAYMPEPHAEMVRAYRKRWQGCERVRDHVRKCAVVLGPLGAALGKAFHECVKELRDFRRFHLTTVQRYLARTDVGTGATAWRRLLQNTLVATQAASLGGWGTVAEALREQIPADAEAQKGAPREAVDAGEMPEVPNEEVTVAGVKVSKETTEPETMPEELRSSLGPPSVWHLARLKWAMHENKPGEHFKLVFPHSMDQLSAFGEEWLTQAFHAAGTLPADNSVSKILSVKEFKGGGAAAKAVLEVEYAKEDAQLHKKLFVKMSLDPSEKNRLFCVFLAMEGKECLFNRFLASRVPFRTPKFYFADLSMSTTNWILISEALPFADDSVRGQRLAPFVIEPPVVKAMDWGMPDVADKYYCLIRKAAMLTSWAHSGKLGGQLLQWFQRNYPPKAQGIPLQNFEKEHWPLLEEFVLCRAVNLFPPEVADVGYMAELKKELLTVAPMLGWMHQFVVADESLWGYMHINLHLDNGFFWRDEEGRQDCGLLDWGGASVGFLPTCFYGSGGALSLADHSVRIGHTGGLVQTFVETLEEFGGPKLDPIGLLLRVCLLDMMTFLPMLPVIEKGGFGGIYERLPREKWRGIKSLDDPVFTGDGIEALMLRATVVGVREGLLTWRGRHYFGVFSNWKAECERQLAAAQGKPKEE